MSNANDKQIGGSHYKDCGIEPWDYVLQNKLGPLEHGVIKYVTRHRHKGGKQDLEKAMHYLEKAMEWYYTDPEPGDTGC